MRDFYKYSHANIQADGRNNGVLALTVSDRTRYISKQNVPMFLAELIQEAGLSLADLPVLPPPAPETEWIPAYEAPGRKLAVQPTEEVNTVYYGLGGVAFSLYGRVFRFSSPLIDGKVEVLKETDR